MTVLDEDALAGLKATSRERKLSTAERIAIYAFGLRGVPPKVIARTFGVKVNAIYYINNWETTAAHENAKNGFEQYGEDRVWTEIVTSEQIESINQGINALLHGKKLNDRGHYRNARRRPRARRAGTIIEAPEATGDGENGRGSPN